MYCTTDPKLIEAELAKCRRIIAALEPKERHEGDTFLTQGEMDALITARETIAVYERGHDTPDEERHTATDQELAMAIADTCREIEEAMVADEIPRSVRSFSELHDYCDANCLGGCCDEDNPRAWWTVASYNALQNAVHARLAAGDFNADERKHGHIMVTRAYAEDAKRRGIKYPLDWIEK